MPATLRPAQERLFAFLTRKTSGDIVTEAEILRSTGWKASTLKTYRCKNILEPFLASVGGGQFRVLRDGTSISKADIASAFTQVRAGILTLTKGTLLSGSSGKYELQRYLGQGAVAHVWQAQRQGDPRKYAAKVLNPRPDLLEPRMLANVAKRFSREARNGINLSHSNLIPYRDFGEIRGHPFLVMDLPDESLAEALKQGPLKLARSLPIVHSCLLGLHYLHNLGCVHRDIKPPNILKFGVHFVLGDLGIVLWSDMNPAFTTAGTMTRASLQLGSWHYMAPEQRLSPHDVTPLSDVYSLGITWYEMLRGNAPDPAEVGAKKFAPPSSSESVNKLIGTMLDFEPSKRPSVPDLIAQLATLEKSLGENSASA